MLNKFVELTQDFRSIACDLEKIDFDVYRTYNRDPLEPIIGMGPHASELCIFGRDPGRQEVEHQVPFIGAGGQKVRKELYAARFGHDMPGFKESLEIGDTVFWANTVPYKPFGNKAWGERIKKRFKPLMTRVLLEHWRGKKIITLGREAFLWFAIDTPKEEKAIIQTFWSSEERFSKALTITITTEQGLSREIELLPLPHPSPLNATWYKKFPELLRQRLKQVGY